MILLDTVLDTVSPKAVHPHFIGETFRRRYNIHGHACPEDGVMPDYNGIEWCAVSAQRYCESSEASCKENSTEFERVIGRLEMNFGDKERDKWKSTF